MKKYILGFLLLVCVGLSYGETLTESKVGGDISGAITITIEKYYDFKTSSMIKKVVVTYETRDSNGVLIRTGVVDITGDLTATQLTNIDSFVTKAIQKVKTNLSIP